MHITLQWTDLATIKNIICQEYLENVKHVCSAFSDFTSHLCRMQNAEITYIYDYSLSMKSQHFSTHNSQL